MVMGTDTAGRLNEEAMIQWWKDQTKSAGDVPFLAFVFRVQAVGDFVVLGVGDRGG